MENKNYILKNNFGEVICERMIKVSNILARMRGLMFSKKLPDCDGFLIAPCNSIHTFFMLYSLDIVFLDSQFKVVKVIYDLAAWRMTGIYFRSHQVLEMKAGTLKKGIKIGDQFEAVCIN